MTYDTIATFSMVSSLLLYIFLFCIVLAYVFWPSTKQKLEKAQHQALDLKENLGRTKGQIS